MIRGLVGAAAGFYLGGIAFDKFQPFGPPCASVSCTPKELADDELKRKLIQGIGAIGGYLIARRI